MNICIYVIAGVSVYSNDFENLLRKKVLMKNTEQTEYLEHLGSLIRSTGVRDKNNVSLLLYGLPCKEKLINLKMASGMAETCLWESCFITF